MHILATIVIIAIVVWLVFIYAFDHDPDTQEFTMRPWARKLWERWKK